VRPFRVNHAEIPLFCGNIKKSIRLTFIIEIAIKGSLNQISQPTNQSKIKP
jgi:hypothetical protein